MYQKSNPPMRIEIDKIIKLSLESLASGTDEYETSILFDIEGVENYSVQIIYVLNLTEGFFPW